MTFRTLPATFLALLLATPLAAEDTQDTAAEPTAAESAETEATDGTAAETAALTGDAEAGADPYKKNCRSCHGPKAQGMASFPKLSDHDFDYLVMRLEQYRAGEKVGPNTALMAPRAKNLTDQEIADLAAFIVSQAE